MESLWEFRALSCGSWVLTFLFLSPAGSQTFWPENHFTFFKLLSSSKSFWSCGVTSINIYHFRNLSWEFKIAIINSLHNYILKPESKWAETQCSTFLKISSISGLRQLDSHNCLFTLLQYVVFLEFYEENPASHR